MLFEILLVSNSVTTKGLTSVTYRTIFLFTTFGNSLQLSAQMVLRVLLLFKVHETEKRHNKLSVFERENEISSQKRG